MSTELSTAGHSISLTMASGKTTIDQISHQTIPTAVTLLDKLNDIAINLDNVSRQMRQNPAVILRGNGSPKIGPGE